MIGLTASCAVAMTLVLLFVFDSSMASKDESLFPRFVEPVPNVTVTVGRDALLACVVEDLRGYKVAWVRVDTQTILSIHHNIITQNPRISLSYNDHRSWYLHIKNVQEVDRGWYMCQVNTDPMRSRKGYLQVVVPPTIIDNMTSTDMVVREGTNVTMVCRATGYPEPYVMWRREDGQEFNCNGESVNVVDGENLTISKVSRLHMGAYLCIASNGVPPSISKRIVLMVQSRRSLVKPLYLMVSTVQHKWTETIETSATHRLSLLSCRPLSLSAAGYTMADPKRDKLKESYSYEFPILPPMLSIPNQLEAAYIGQDVTLECNTEAFPSSINYWTTDRGDMIISGNKYITSLSDDNYSRKMKMTIRKVSSKDFSSYRCVAKNSLGETDGLIRLDEIPAPSTISTTINYVPTFPAKKKGKHKNRWRDTSAENRVIGDYEVEEWKDVDYESTQTSCTAITRGVWFAVLLSLLISS